jgi:hypothetical protein
LIVERCFRSIHKVVSEPFYCGEVRPRMATV